MTLIDVILGVVIIIAFFSGWKKGLFVAAASFIGIVLGIYGAVYFSDYAAAYISKWFDWSESATNIVSFAVTFFAIVTLVSFAGKLLTKIADFAMLGIFNKLLGGVFNALAWAVILSILLIFTSTWGPTSDLISEEKKESSRLYYPIMSIAPMIGPDLLEDLADLPILNKSSESEGKE